MKRKYYKNINEVVYTTTLKNKMHVYLLYKKGFVEKDAYIATKFGHFDSIRNIKVDNKLIKIPWGVAHFLEHRMFSIQDQDASDLFALNGASCNAYTTYEKTAYYFSCNTKFYENLFILLKMMNQFSSSNEQVENEKSIILQESYMSKEDPIHIILKTLYQNAYIHHPINMDIIGTEETIKNTSKEILKSVYDTFYDPSNLSLVVAGDIDPNELEEYLNQHLLTSKNSKKIVALKIEEPMEVIKEQENLKLSTIQSPRFGILYKLKQYKDKTKKDQIYFAYMILLDYLFASSGKYSEKWLKEGTLKTLLDYSVTSNIDLDNIIIYNSNENPEEVLSKLKSVFSKNSKVNMSQEELEDIKKYQYGATIKAYDSVNDLCSGFVYDLFSSSTNEYFDEVDVIRSITLQDIEEAFTNICEAATSSVVLRRN